MKNLLPIFALLLLVGCTSELDRCIEANTPDFTNEDFEYKSDTSLEQIKECQLQVHKEKTEEEKDEIYNMSIGEWALVYRKDLIYCVKKLDPGFKDRYSKKLEEDAIEICNVQEIY